MSALAYFFLLFSCHRCRHNPLARFASIEGDADLHLSISASCWVEKADVVSASGSADLDEAALVRVREAYRCILDASSFKDLLFKSRSLKLLLSWADSANSWNSRMQTLTFPSWADFRHEVNDRWHGPLIYWRGQADSDWPLASSFERKVLRMFGGSEFGASQVFPYSTKASKNRYRAADGSKIDRSDAFSSWRNSYLEKFKKKALGRRGTFPPNLSDNDWWAVGRHFGLITPLLDWTELPYVAAFFALTELYDRVAADDLNFTPGSVPDLKSSSRKAAVYRLRRANLDSNDSRFRVLDPSVDELGRSHAQRSVFTMLDSDEYFEVQGYIDNSVASPDEALMKFELTSETLIEGLTDLTLHGIGFGSIYPDLEGAARDCNSDYLQSPPFSPGTRLRRVRYPGT